MSGQENSEHTVPVATLVRPAIPMVGGTAYPPLPIEPSRGAWAVLADARSAAIAAQAGAGGPGISVATGGAGHPRRQAGGIQVAAPRTRGSLV